MRVLFLILAGCGGVTSSFEVVCESEDGVEILFDDCVCDELVSTRCSTRIRGDDMQVMTASARVRGSMVCGEGCAQIRMACPLPDAFDVGNIEGVNGELPACRTEVTDR